MPTVTVPQRRLTTGDLPAVCVKTGAPAETLPGPSLVELDGVHEAFAAALHEERHAPC